MRPHTYFTVFYVQNYLTHRSTVFCLVEDEASRHWNPLLQQGMSEISIRVPWAQQCSQCPSWHLQWKDPSFFNSVLIFTSVITAFFSNGKYKLHSVLQDKDKLFFLCFNKNNNRNKSNTRNKKEGKIVIRRYLSQPKY